LCNALYKFKTYLLTYLDRKTDGSRDKWAVLHSGGLLSDCCIIFCKFECDLFRLSRNKCDALDCGTEAEEGWEMVQRTNKTKFRPSPTSGPPCKTSVPARQADGDGRRTASQLRRKEGNCRANVTVSRQTRVAAADARKQHCSVSAVDVSGNCNNSTKSSPINPTQQSKSSSHIGASHGDKGTKSSHRVMQLPLTVNNSHSETVKSETCLTTAEVPAVGAASGTDSKLGENNVTGSGDRRQTAFSESQLHNSGRVSCHSAASHADSSELSVGGVTDVILTHDLSSRTFSSMTEIHRSDSADIQRSSSDSDRQSLYLCRKSVSDDTLVERMTASGDDLIAVILSVVSFIHSG